MRRIMRLALFSFVWVLLIASIAGCALTDNGKAPEAEDIVDESSESETAEIIPPRYTITMDFGNWNNPMRWVIGHNGETVEEDYQTMLLNDVLTGEPQCVMHTKLEATGKDADGNILTRDVSALYDLDGNLLYDWDEYVYKEAFGDYLVRQNRWMMFYEETLPEDFETELWNYKTNEPLIPDVGKAYRVSGDEALLVTEMYVPIGIVDAAGGKRGGFPFPEQYVNIQDTTGNGLIIAGTRPFFASTEDGHPDLYYLLNSDLEPVLTSDGYMALGITGSMLRYYDAPADRIIIADLSGETLYEIPSGEWEYYFDEELAVIHSGEYDNADNPERFRLVRLSDGETIADEFEILSFDYQSAGKNPTARFLGYKEGTLRLIGRDGKTLAERQISGVRYLDVYGDGLYRVTIRKEDDQYTDAILDNELNEIIPLGIYANVMKTYGWSDNDNHNIFTGDRPAGGSALRLIDVLDYEGNLLIEGLDNIFDAGQNRLAVRKGFDIGLMDWRGNWIVKRSIFSELVND